VRKDRGLSLLELILSTTILAVIGTFALLSFQHPRGSAQSRALAETMMEELRAARQQAVATQSPVALAFPSEGGSVGTSQSFYQLEGLAEAKVVRAVDYSGNFPEACLFWGSWGGTDSSVDDFGLNQDFDVESWVPAEFTDNLLIFTPGGTAVSPNIPSFSGEFRLLTSRGVRESGGRLSEVSSPFTIHISRAGAVSLSTGVAGGPSVGTRSRLEVRAAKLPQLKPNRSDKSPEILKISVEPKAIRMSSSDEVQARVPTRGYLLLKVRAKDDSDRLTLMWEGRAQGGGGEGYFSAEQPTPMAWNSKEQVWEGTWMWTPNRDSEPGQRFLLKCAVEDRAGNRTEAKLGAGLLVEIVDDQRIATVNKSLNDDFEVVSLNPSGGNIKRLTLPGYADQEQNLTPSWSPNGRRIAFFSGVRRDTPYTPHEPIEATLFVVNDDGLDLRALYKVRGTFNELALGPSWSPDGTYVAFSAYSVTGSPSAPTVNARAYKVPVYDDNSAWGQNFGINAPKPVPISNSRNSVGDVRSNDFIDSDVRFHPKHNWILFVRERSDGAGGRESVLMVKRANDNAEILDESLFKVADVDSDRRGAEAYWSPDGKRIVYVTKNGFNLRVADVIVNRDTFRIQDDYRIFRGLKGPLQPDQGENENFSTDDLVLNVNPSTPRFSRKGNNVAFVDQRRGKLFVLYLDEVDGKLTLVKRNKADHTGDLHYFCWAPTGDELLYNTHLEGELFRVEVDRNKDFSPLKISPDSMHAWTTPAWWFKYNSIDLGDDEE